MSKSIVFSPEKPLCSNLFFHTILDSLLHDCWCMDIDKRYNYQNSTSRTNWGDVIGLSIEELDIQEELKDLWKDEIDIVFGGKQIDSEYYVEEYGVWLKSVILPLYEQDEIIGAAGITIDISEYKKQERKIEQQNVELQELNSALNVLIRKMNADMRRREEFLALMIDNSIMPLINALKKAEVSPGLVSKLEAEVSGLVPSADLGPDFPLTKTERLVAELIKDGCTSKEIAKKLNIEPSTVCTHRNNIRKKLDLKKSSIGLFEYLNTV